MKKMIAMTLAALLALSLLTACGAGSTGSDLTYIQDKGTLIVGITDYEPMDYKDENGQWIGFDADFARLFAEELGVECQFYVIADWNKKFMELDTRQIDVVWNGMTITDEVKLNTNCSDPYVVDAQTLVMKADRVSDYPDAASITGLTVAVENGSAGQDAAAAIGVENLILTQDQASALLEVFTGASDACVVDGGMVNAMTGEGKDYDTLAAGFSLTSDVYGVGFRKESDVTAKFNEFMDKLMADGTLQALSEKYDVVLVE